MRLGDNFRKMRDAGPHCFRPFVRNMSTAHNDNSERYCAFHFNTSVAPGHSIQTLHWRCAGENDRAKIFPLLQVGQDGLVNVSTPDDIGFKFVHLVHFGPLGIP